MRVTSTLMLAALACLSLFGEGYAQGVHAVRPIPGLVCMSLSPEDEAATQQSQLPPILAAPSATAPRIGFPTGIVFVKWPIHQVNDFVEMTRLDGQTGWIDAHHLRPWHSMNKSNAKCVPSLMSNGRLGTQIK